MFSSTALQGSWSLQGSAPALGAVLWLSLGIYFTATRSRSSTAPFSSHINPEHTKQHWSEPSELFFNLSCNWSEKLPCSTFRASSNHLMMLHYWKGRWLQTWWGAGGGERRMMGDGHSDWWRENDIFSSSFTRLSDHHSIITVCVSDFTQTRSERL